MVLAPSFVLAEVKWFGGQNRQTGIKNDFGFAESAIGVDVFIHKSVVDGSLSEGQFVLLKIEKSQKGYSATKCIHDPIKSQSGIMLELIDKDNDYLNTTWKNRLRRQVKDNIPADYFTTLSPDNLVPSIEDLYGDELETMSEFTPWVEDYEIDSEGIKVIEIINLLIKNKPVESVPEKLINFIFKLPLVILPRLERFSELIKIDIIRERFIDFFKEKDVQERVIAEKLLIEGLADQSRFYTVPNIVKSFIEKALSDDPKEMYIQFYNGIINYLKQSDYSQLSGFLEKYRNYSADTDFLLTFFPDERFQMALIDGDDLSIYPEDLINTKTDEIEKFIRDNPTTTSVDQLLDVLNAETVVDICLTKDVDYRGLETRTDVSDLIALYIENQESNNIPPMIAKYLKKIDANDPASVESFFISKSNPEIIKKLIGPQLGLTLLFNKSEMANWMFFNGYAGQLNMHNFILFTLLPLLIKNSSDTAYNVFKLKLWKLLIENQLDLDKSIMSLFPSCSTMQDLSCEAVFWTKEKLFLCRGRKCAYPKVIPDMDKHFRNFTIYEWLKHYSIDYLKPGRPANTDFAHKLAGYFNRLKEQIDVLHCRKCDKVLMPNFKYSRTEFIDFDVEKGKYVKKSMAARYRVDVFRCANKNCNKFEKDIYITHCLGQNCNSVIDSRDLHVQCSNNLYVCDLCCACCKKHLREYPPGLCPKCGQQIIVWEKNRKRFVNCSNRRCDFQIKTVDMPRRLLLKSVPVRYPGQNIPPDDIYDDEANQYDTMAP